jgi:8-oxo-dGTP diphosphatase/2-hydroxy-dATP diphosphatase
MKPEWFDYRPSTDPAAAETDSGPSTDTAPLPWDKMWEDDRFWLPLIWDRRKFVGRADFSEFGDITKGATSEAEGTSMLRWWFATVDPGVIDAP